MWCSKKPCSCIFGEWCSCISPWNVKSFWWVVPPPSNSDHQDYYIFSRDPYKPSFATGILGGGTTQYIHIIYIPSYNLKISPHFGGGNIHPKNSSGTPMTRPALKLMVIRCRGAALGGTWKIWVEENLRFFVMNHVVKTRYSKSLFENDTWKWYLKITRCLKMIFEYDSIFECQKKKLPKYHSHLDVLFPPIYTFQKPSTLPKSRQNRMSMASNTSNGHRAQCPSHDGKIKTVPGHKDKVQSWEDDGHLEDGAARERRAPSGGMKWLITMVIVFVP